ncbi:cupin domain-containing protein [Candidatus Pantoea carbekii]|uniref:cupin domain-containing protein n=1 Tax=Candidatus Pantoea carbekii TaxID=1235990 RepID=UPI00061881DD|nr:cupin domain-containing protein [Candidatus Pantoea carbekii]
MKLDNLSRRNFMTFAAASSTIFLTAAKIYSKKNKNIIQSSNIQNSCNPSSRDSVHAQLNPDLIDPPFTDSGTLPNLRFSFSDAHVRKGSGGWTRQITQRELGISTTIAGVNMRLQKGGIRELHWHKEAEWAYMLYGKGRITLLDSEGHWFISDLSVGDLWYFPSGIPHSIQGLDPDGCEFLLAFDDGNFDEDSTFLLSDWFKHIPPEVLAKNFNMPISIFNTLPSPENEYIFSGNEPNKMITEVAIGGKKSKLDFSYKMLAQKPFEMPGGTVRIVDSKNFLVSKTIAAALVELEPGAMRELHWHPNNDEWQYYLQGEGRMGVFAASGQARTFNFRGGDVGYVPFAMGHYIENTGNILLRFLELFKSDYYADISLKQWLANTPSNLVRQHLNLDESFLQSLQLQKYPIVK